MRQVLWFGWFVVPLLIVLLIDLANWYVLYFTFSCELSVLYTLLLDHMLVHHADDYMIADLCPRQSPPCDHLSY